MNFIENNKISRIDIVCDIETLGRTQSPPVFQIAACAFDIKTGTVYDKFNSIVDIRTIANIEGDTLLWWLNTDKELLTKLLNEGKGGQKTEKYVIYEFTTWICNLTVKLNIDIKSVYFWGNGILFDNRIISQKCKDFDLVYPIFYRNDRDVRTLLELACIKTNKSREEFEGNRETIAHDALNDTLFEKQIICNAYRAIIGE